MSNKASSLKNVFLVELGFVYSQNSSINYSKKNLCQCLSNGNNNKTKQRISLLWQAGHFVAKTMFTMKGSPITIKEKQLDTVIESL